MNRYTVFDYENYLVIENKLDEGISQILLEKQGIVDNYDKIIEEIYNTIIDEKPVPNNDNISYMTYVLQSHVMEFDCFFYTVDILLHVGKREDFKGSYFFCNYKKPELTKDLKLKKAIFVIGIDSKDIKSENGRKEFFSEMSHELQHAYRFYNICLSNNGAISDEAIRLDNYKEALDVLEKSKDESMGSFIASLLYSIDKNEISSECNRLFEYIKQNENINDGNYTAYLKDMPLYKLIRQLQTISSRMDDYLRMPEKVDEIGSIYKAIKRNQKQSNGRAFIELRMKIIASCQFALRKFYKTLGYAFDKFGRRGKKTWAENLARMITFEYNDIDKDLKKLLK